jgi:bacterioferritin-associated ferredoxin
MIVCVCKSVSDRSIRASIDAGVASFEELQFELGVALCCGKCEHSVRHVLAENSAGQDSGAPPATAPVLFYERKAA